MLDRTYPDQVCSIARALEVVGERWSVLIVRDAFLGRERFSEFQRSLGIARNVLSQRLGHLVDEGVLEHADDGRYLLTRKGRELAPALHQLMKWGDQPLRARGPAAPDAAPRLRRRRRRRHGLRPLRRARAARRDRGRARARRSAGDGAVADDDVAGVEARGLARGGAVARLAEVEREPTPPSSATVHGSGLER